MNWGVFLPVHFSWVIIVRLQVFRPNTETGRLTYTASYRPTLKAGSFLKNCIVSSVSKKLVALSKAPYMPIDLPVGRHTDRCVVLFSAGDIVWRTKLLWRIWQCSSDHDCFWRSDLLIHNSKGVFYHILLLIVSSCLIIASLSFVVYVKHKVENILWLPTSENMVKVAFTTSFCRTFRLIKWSLKGWICAFRVWLTGLYHFVNNQHRLTYLFHSCSYCTGPLILLPNLILTFIT